MSFSRGDRRCYMLTPSPFGQISIVWRESEEVPRVYRIFLPNEQALVQDLVRAAFRDICQSSHTAIAELGERIRSFLEGEAVAFGLDMLAFEQCSEFQQRVLLAEREIPRGWVSTYGRIANHLGVASGARAVGRALARNPFPIVIPCHRAIRANGELGGYQGGLEMKRALLEFEGVQVSGSGKVLAPRMYY